MPPEETKKINDTTWEIPESYKEGMNVPARVIATEKLLKQMDDGVFDQITNVATLPGIQGYAYAMPDAHWGYGFPVGGVAAFDLEEGIISPGGLGFDLNCGMRLLRTNLTKKEVEPKIKELVNKLFDAVPTGVGASTKLKLSDKEMDEMAVDGVKWCVEQGYGWENDTKRIEEHGFIDGADPEKVSQKAKNRGRKQVGTLGSGNHYLEIQYTKPDLIFDKEAADSFDIRGDEQICVMIHSGSRGFGHQIATDYLRRFEKAMRSHGIDIPDKELSCAPFKSNAGQDYYKAMACAANFAFSNRQLMTHNVRKVFSEVFNEDAEDLGIDIVYDVAHNIGKIEDYKVNGKKKKLLVHRKGATRAFGPHHPELWDMYKDHGQPVIIGGSMETGSYLLVGTKKSQEETFGSTAHGSGRTMSRTKAKKQVRGEKLQKDMEERGIYVKAASMPGLAEEAGLAYKPINDVIEAIEKAGISKAVCGLKPLGNIKG